MDTRTETPSLCGEHRQLLSVLSTQPMVPQPVAGVHNLILWDIQPILDQHCLECHNHDREEGDFNISGHWGPLYPVGYIQMSWRELFGDNRVILPYAEHSRSNFEPYEIGTGSSRLLQLIERGHEGVHMPEHQQKIIRHWLDAGRSARNVCREQSRDDRLLCARPRKRAQNDKDWPETQAMVEVMNRRCNAATRRRKRNGRSAPTGSTSTPSSIRQMSFRIRYVAHTMSEDGAGSNRHLIFNLSYPNCQSSSASVARATSGLGVCEAESGQVIFADRRIPFTRPSSRP